MDTWADVYATERDRTISILKGKGYNADAAEDAVQDAYLRLIGSTAEPSVAAFVRCAKNRASNSARTERTQGKLMAEFSAANGEGEVLLITRRPIPLRGRAYMDKINERKRKAA